MIYPNIHDLDPRDVDLAVARGDLQRLEHWVREFMAERQQVEDTLQRWQDEKAGLEDEVDSLESELYDARKEAEAAMAKARAYAQDVGGEG